MIKRLLLFLLILGLLLGRRNVSAAVAREDESVAQLPRGTLTADKLHHLFSRQTVDSMTAVQRREGTSYFDPKGEIRQLRLGKIRRGRWWITANHRICLQMERSAGEMPGRGGQSRGSAVSTS